MLLGPLIQLHDPDDPLRSDTTLLAAAFIALGFPPASRDLFHLTCETRRGETVWRTVWSFHGASQESSLSGLGGDVVKKAWRDPSGAWLLENPGHPLQRLREALGYDRMRTFTPQWSRAQLAQLSTPEAFLEAGYRNLLHILNALPRAMEEARVVERFSATRAAFVPRCLPESEKTRRLKFAETTDHDKRRSILAA